MNTVNKTTVINFVEEIWNQKQFDKIEHYVSADFIDHSLPPALLGNTDGMKRWIMGTGKAFEHKTIINDIISEGDKVVLKVKMQMTHIGVWREIEPTYLQMEIDGFRMFRCENNKIIEHWALIDGNAMEKKLKETAKGCRV